MTSSTFKAKLEELGIIPSHSRPRVSNDNAFAESIFKTVKYCPQWPSYVCDFVEGYPQPEVQPCSHISNSPCRQKLVLSSQRFGHSDPGGKMFCHLHGFGKHNALPVRLPMVFHRP